MERGGGRTEIPESRMLGSWGLIGEAIVRQRMSNHGNLIYSRRGKRTTVARPPLLTITTGVSYFCFFCACLEGDHDYQLDGTVRAGIRFVLGVSWIPRAADDWIVNQHVHSTPIVLLSHGWCQLDRGWFPEYSLLWLVCTNMIGHSVDGVTETPPHCHHLHLQLTRAAHDPTSTPNM